MDHPLTIDRRGAAAVALGAAVWGLFWIALRYLDGVGLNGLWAIVSVMAAGAVPAFLLCWHRGEAEDLKSPFAWIIGTVLGASSVLYFVGVMLSDVIRVILLFYLLPIWTTLAARVIYGELIRKAHLIVMLLAFAGVWLLLGGGGLPIPNNVGDWCGLLAGLLWGISLALLRKHQDTRPMPSSAITLLMAGCLGLITVVLLAQRMDGPWLATPDSSALLGSAPAWIAFGALVLFPAFWLQIWGAQRVPAPTAALLTMTEIIVATLSAWWLVGTDLTPVSAFGGVLVIISVLADLRIKFQQMAA